MKESFNIDFCKKLIMLYRHFFPFIIQTTIGWHFLKHSSFCLISFWWIIYILWYFGLPFEKIISCLFVPIKTSHVLQILDSRRHWPLSSDSSWCRDSCRCSILRLCGEWLKHIKAHGLAYTKKRSPSESMCLAYPCKAVICYTRSSIVIIGCHMIATSVVATLEFVSFIFYSYIYNHSLIQI